MRNKYEDGYRTAYIALGSNQGDRQRQLLDALNRLNEGPGVEVTRVSAVYETDPVGYTEQPAFLNMAAAVRTTLEPYPLLHRLLEVETSLGRVRLERWGPRTIDLDLIFMDGVEMQSEELTLPHPRYQERAFVLVPLSEVLDQAMPLRDQVINLAEQALRQGKEGITLWSTINWRSESAPFES